MKLFTLFVVFLICLYINYKLGIEGFDAIKDVSTILGYVLGGIFLLCFGLYFLSSSIPRFSYSTNATTSKY